MPASGSHQARPLRKIRWTRSVDKVDGPHRHAEQHGQDDGQHLHPLDLAAQDLAAQLAGITAAMPSGVASAIGRTNPNRAA